MCHTRCHEASEEVTYTYDNRSDESLIQLARKGDQLALEHLVRRYRRFIQIKTRHYYMPGADHQDMMQEGMIGLWKAIRDFCPGVAAFRTFANICIERQLITAVEIANSRRHAPLNYYVSFSLPLYEENGDQTLEDILPAAGLTDPEEIVPSQMATNIIFRELKQFLSDLEWRVLRAFIKSGSYPETASEAGITVKSVDNALQRIRRKMQRFRGGRSA